jgi:hypothetical protein
VARGCTDCSIARRLAATGLAGLVLCAIPGCGPEVSRRDLGTVTFDLPAIAGADKPYQMPQLYRSTGGKSDTEPKDLGRKSSD